MYLKRTLFKFEYDMKTECIDGLLTEPQFRPLRDKGSRLLYEIM